MTGIKSPKKTFAIVPDHHTMLWHHKKEEFICQKLFGKHPHVKGAVTGEVGSRVWAIWTRGFSGALEDPDSGSKLYILRLVLENPALASNSEESGLQMKQLKAILEAAQAQAAEWKLPRVELWNPDSSVQDLIERMGIQHWKVEREKEAISSLLWYGNDSGKEDEVEWIASEKFAWC
jgi:hypothetical protein